MNRDTFLQSVDALIDRNGSKGTTGESLKSLLDNLAQSVVFIDELGASQFTRYNPALNYIKDDVVIYNGQIYIADQAATGAFDPTKWDMLPGLDFLFTFGEWNEGNAYVADDEVRYRFKIYKALVNTTGENPETTPLSWEVVQVNNGKWGNAWQAGYYFAGDVIKRNEAFWQVSPASLKSVDFDAEVTAGYIQPIANREFKKTYQLTKDDFRADLQEVELAIDAIPGWAVISEVVVVNKEYFSGEEISLATLDVTHLGHTVLLADIHTAVNNQGAFGRPTTGVFPGTEPNALKVKVRVGDGETTDSLSSGIIDLTVYYKILAWHEV